MYNVLIADDELTIRKGLGIMIDWEEHGFHIEGEAANGAEALRMLQERRYDVLISDIRMPKMSGLELIKRINEMELNVKVVIISSHSEFEYARTAIEYGAVNYVMKPINQEQLVQTMVRIRKRNDLEQRLGAEPNRAEAEPSSTRISARSHDAEVISQIRHYIREHCSDDINLISIGKAFNYNPVYLGRLFSKNNGESFRNYLNHCRIRKAEKLIAEGRHKVFEISDLVGYRDLNYFCKTFKKIAGKTPGEYKLQHAARK